MPARYLLESGTVDGYQLEDATGVLILESPTPTRGRISWAEFEVAFVPTRGRVSFAELEVPTVPTRGRVSWAELQAPFVPTRGRNSWSEFEVPAIPTRGRVSWAEFEVPDAAASDEEHKRCGGQGPSGTFTGGMSWF